MNKNSIIFSTTLNFLITSLLLIVSFIFLLSHENFKKNEQIFERYKPIIKMVSGKKFYFDKDFHKNLLDKVLGLRKIEIVGRQKRHKLKLRKAI